MWLVVLLLWLFRLMVESLKRHDGVHRDEVVDGNKQMMIKVDLQQQSWQAKDANELTGRMSKHI